MTTPAQGANKLTVFRKKLIKEGLVIAGVVVAIGVVTAMVVGWDEAAQAAKVQAQSLLSTAQSEVDIAKAQLSSIDEHMEAYRELDEKRDNEVYELNRAVFQDQMAALRAQYRLSELSLQLAPEQKLEMPALANNEVEAFSAEVKLTLASMTDQHVYSFVQAMQRSLPGFVKLKQMTLKRNLNFDVNVLRQISKGDSVKMVSGDVVFDWIGLAPKPKAKTPKANKDGGAGT